MKYHNRLPDNVMVSLPNHMPNHTKQKLPLPNFQSKFPILGELAEPPNYQFLKQIDYQPVTL